MALGSIASAVAAPLISSGVSFLGSKLFGGSKKKRSPVQEFKPVGFNAGGLTGAFSGGRFNVTSDANRQGLVSTAADSFGGQADLTRGLRDQLQPGFSNLRDVRLRGLEDVQRRTIGNLKENLQRRRVLGSSFGADALSRAEAEFGRERSKIEGQTFLEELDLTNQLIGQEFELRRSGVERFINELNLQADIGQKLAADASTQLGANARLKEEILASQAGAGGKFVGQQIVEPLQSAFSSIFNRPNLSSIGDNLAFSTTTRDAAGNIVG